MRFSCLSEPTCEGFQTGVVICRDQSSLKHHVAQGTATSGDGPFPAKGSAVVRDRGQSSECSSLSAGDGDPVETPWTQDWDAQHKAVAAIAPLKRSATPDDCAEAVLALVRNRYVTGEVFVVDGGLTQLS